jgi:hypothetical protein
VFIGTQGRFSTDLDFTATQNHEPDDMILLMMEAFEQTFHGIEFAIDLEAYYETQDGLSWGANPTYHHDWNPSAQPGSRQAARRSQALVDA